MVRTAVWRRTSSGALHDRRSSLALLEPREGHGRDGLPGAVGLDLDERADGHDPDGGIVGPASEQHLPVAGQPAQLPRPGHDRADGAVVEPSLEADPPEGRVAEVDADGGGDLVPAPGVAGAELLARLAQREGQVHRAERGVGDGFGVAEEHEDGLPGEGAHGGAVLADEATEHLVEGFEDGELLLGAGRARHGRQAPQLPREHGDLAAMGLQQGQIAGLEHRLGELG